jgi:lauroyl/myristoyl acyltransferase
MGKMNVQAILNSRIAVETALRLGRALPTTVGYAVADLVGGVISHKRRLAPVRAMRANQYVVHDRALQSEELDRAVRTAFKAAARSIFDFYHWMDQPKMLLSKVIIEESFERIIHQTQRGERGTILALPHIGNFDLVGRASVLKGMSFQVITPPAPPGGYQVQNSLRREAGMEITPASLEAVRKATQRLRAGGCVVTGVDRPLPDVRQMPRFFGLPSSVPVAHVRLGLRLGLPVNVVGVGQDAKGRYHLWASEGIEMERHNDPDEEVLANAEKVLELVEKNIRSNPAQWNMTYPVWPQMLEETP